MIAELPDDSVPLCNLSGGRLMSIRFARPALPGPEVIPRYLISHRLVPAKTGQKHREGARTRHLCT